MTDAAKEKAAKLTGWKEIAAFVGREVRTVQRWERELGLPVYRVPGSHGHSVFASPDEIERWFKGGRFRATLSEEQLRQFTLKCSDAPMARSLPQTLPQPPASASGTVTPRTRSATSMPMWRLRKRTAFGALAVISVAAFVYASSGHRLLTLLGSGQPVISSVSPILPRADQTIVIRGHALGRYTDFTNLDTPYLAIRNHSASWAAGRIIPENQDEITLSVSRWTDSEIVISGLAGGYGRFNWTLHPSDEIEIAVWNPQTGAGPALFHLKVSRDTSDAQ